MKKIIIFGATGNIGAYFTDYCKNNLDTAEYEVIAVGRRKTDFFSKNGIEYIEVDLCVPDDFDKLPTEDVYAVVNVAGLLPAYMKQYDPFAYVETNIMVHLGFLSMQENVMRIEYFIHKHGPNRQVIGEKEKFYLQIYRENYYIQVIMLFMQLRKR